MNTFDFYIVFIFCPECFVTDCITDTHSGLGGEISVMSSNSSTSLFSLSVAVIVSSKADTLLLNLQHFKIRTMPANIGLHISARSI